MKHIRMQVNLNLAIGKYAHFRQKFNCATIPRGKSLLSITNVTAALEG